MLRGGDDYSCKVQLLASSELEIQVKARPRSGETVIIYLDNVGMLQSEVLAITSTGFRAGLKADATRREQISARFDWHRARAAEEAERRAAPRIVPVKREVDIWLGERLIFKGMIVDISLSGIAVTVALNCRPFPDSLVRIGKRPARIVRLTESGFAAEFKTPFTAGTFDKYVVV